MENPTTTNTTNNTTTNTAEKPYILYECPRGQAQCYVWSDGLSSCNISRKMVKENGKWVYKE